MKRLLLAALGLGLALAAPTLASAETLNVGVYPNNPPWEVKQVNGTFTGFEVDLVNDIAKKLGVDVKMQDLGFQALFAATSSHRIDMAISSISITNERLKGQSFTQGYYDTDMALIANNDSKMKSLGDMKGETIGAISASTGEAWIKDHTKQYGIGGYKGYDSQQNLLLDVQSGRIAGGIGDVAGFLWAFKKMPTMHVVARIKTGQQYGIMMPKGSPWLQKVNNAISELKKDGTLPALYKKWLGVAPPKDSSTVEVRELPKAK